MEPSLLSQPADVHLPLKKRPFLKVSRKVRQVEAHRMIIREHFAVG